MAENQSFDGDNLKQTKSITTFSQLLFDDVDVDVDVDDQIFNYSVSNSSSSSSSSFPILNPKPKMLCFGTQDQHHEQHPLLLFNTFTCTTDSKLKRRNGFNPETATIKAETSSNLNASKKNRAIAPYSGHAKRKEKLGERITVLQQLVSPFGKTDTASVLHEAMGYIKFLQEQVQVLCSPYLQQNQLLCFQSPTGDLKSKGLCLIPVECSSSLHLANYTVADFWSPPMAAIWNNNNKL